MESRMASRPVETHPQSAAAGRAAAPESAGDADVAAETNRSRILAAPPTRQSPWTSRQKLTRILWATLGRVLWSFIPPLRSSILRMFGATIGSGCSFARSVEIAIPWNLRLGSGVRVAERVTLYALGPITIGDNVTIDYRAHLCAGSHDLTDPGFPQTRPSISIGGGSFIGADAYIGPGCALGERCNVQPRASVYKSFPDGSVLLGNPAKVVSP
jgi:putative colanic acid biosynthesis acetyltransferase WcaF